MALQHLRSSTADKRPDPTAMADGQLAINTNSTSTGLFYKNSAGALVKVGPAHVGTTAPNATPASGGTAGNSTGEAWLDTSGSNPVLKIWNGSTWQTVQPVASGTVVSTADTGTVTSTMIADGTIVDGDVNASAAIAGTKISPDFGAQNVTTTGTVTGASLNPTSSTVPTNGVYLPAANSVAISTNGTQRINIEADGDINIDSGGVFYDATNNRLAVGTTSPATALEVNGVIRADRGTGHLDITHDGTNGSIVNDTGNLLFYAEGTNSILWHTNNIERARIDSSGRLGIGTSSPDSAIGFPIGTNTVIGQHPSTAHAAGNVGSIGLAISDGGGYSGVFVHNTHNGTYSSQEIRFLTAQGGISTATERMRITQGGKIYWGCTSDPSSSVQGFAYIGSAAQPYVSTSAGSTTSTYTHWYLNNGNGTVGSISTNGSATAFNTSSDYRLKENILPVTDGITRLQQLKPRRFNFIADPDKTVDGFLAHEAQAVVPECVTGEKDAVDDDGNPIYQGIDQSKLVPLLTAALQEAVAKIESLEARLTAAGI